ncbi:MAG: TatD family hydrolase [Candidatus Aenigmatarchaeota archaeon]
MEKDKMIDSHCHLEWRSYDDDRDSVVGRCRKELKAVVSSCSRPWDFDKALAIAEKHSGFVFITAGFHPEFMKDVSAEAKAEYIKKIIANKARLVGIGEIGLDYDWVKEPGQQEASRRLFAEMLGLAKELDLPVVIHSRASHQDVLDILERHGPAKAYLHMWGGHQEGLMKRVLAAGYYVGVNTIVFTSKGYRKVVRDTPLERLLLETDAPWLSLKREGEAWKIDPKARNEPTSIRMVAEKVAEIKGLPFGEIWKACGENAVRFFGLSIKG